MGGEVGWTLNLQGDLVQRAFFGDDDPVFGNFWKAMQDIRQGRRIDIDAANDQHIISSPQHSAIQAEIGATALALIPSMAYQIAAAITQARRSPPAQIGQHQLSYLSLLHRLVCAGIKNFGNEFALVDMHTSLLRAGEAKGPYLSHACMVISPRPPRFLDPLTRCDYRCARLSSVNG